MRKSSLLIALGIVGSLALFGIARARYATTPLPLMPPAWATGPETAAVQLSAGSATEVHTTLTSKGQCIDFSCTVDASYRMSDSAAAVTLASRVAGHTIPANAVLTKCFPNTDYLSVYTSAAGTCQVGEHVAP